MLADYGWRKLPISIFWTLVSIYLTGDVLLYQYDPLFFKVSVLHGFAFKEVPGDENPKS